MKLLVILTTLILTVATHAAGCRDLPTRDYWNSVRFLPVTITAYDGLKVSTVTSTKEEVFFTEFEVDDKTEFPLNFLADYKKKTYFAVYCGSLLLWVQELGKPRFVLETRAEQIKRAKGKG